MFVSRLCPVPSACHASGSTSLPNRASLATASVRPAAAACLPCNGSPRTGVHPGTECGPVLSIASSQAPSESQLHDVNRELRAAVELIRDRVGTNGKQQLQLLATSENLLHAVGDAVLQFPWLDKATMCAAVLAPFLVSDLVEHHELEDMLGQQAAAAAADVRLIIRAAEQFQTDALSLVEWSLQACSVQASLAAALFFLQNPGRSHVGEMFSKLLYHRLGQPSPVFSGKGNNVHDCSNEETMGKVPIRRLVFMSGMSNGTDNADRETGGYMESSQSVTRIVDRNSSSDAGAEMMPKSVAPDTPVRAGIPVSEHGSERVNGQSDENGRKDLMTAGQILAASKIAELKKAAIAYGTSAAKVQMQQSQDGSRPLLFRPGRRIIPKEESVTDDEMEFVAHEQSEHTGEVTSATAGSESVTEMDPEAAAAAAAALLLSEELWIPPIKRPPPIPFQLCPMGATCLSNLDGSPFFEAPQPSATEGEEAQRPGVRIPLLGAFFMTNFPKGFPSSDAVFNSGSTPDRLAVRLEYTMERGDPVAGSKLHVFNCSRVFRGRRAAAVVYVNETPLFPGEAGIQLCDGDEVLIGQGASAARFVVRPSDKPICYVDDALKRYCPPLAAAKSNGTASSSSAPTSPGMPAPGMEYLELARMARFNPEASSEGFMRLAREQPQSIGVWLSWAQLAARLGKVKMARDLFRVAAEVAGDVTQSPPGLPSIPKISSRGRVDNGGAIINSSSSDEEEPNAKLARFAAATGVPGEKLLGGEAQSLGEEQPVKEADRPLRSVDGSWNKPLMQVLFNWGQFEWSKRLFGPARHLWRRSADLALAHPDGWAAGGAGIVLHSWALAELQEDNVRNARILVAEALRKCPEDQPLYVLAGSVELAGGNYDLAKAFCLRAYELNRLDKNLYYVWPKVEAASGESDRARVLFERALEYHPKNTKIMNMYAQFEEEQGDIDAARELHDRALETDPYSATTMHNRAAWAALEVDEGNLQFAHELAEEGLEIHGDSPASVGVLVVLAKLARVEGRLEDARMLLDRASKHTNNFNTAIMKERSLLFHAAGETAMAKNLAAHLSGMKRLTEMKKAGAWGWQAWNNYFREAGSEKRRALAKAAHARKQELGIWDGPGKPGPVMRGEKEGRPLQTKKGFWEPLPPPTQQQEAEEEFATEDVAGNLVGAGDASQFEEQEPRAEVLQEAEEAVELEEEEVEQEEEESHIPMLHRDA